MIEHDTSIDPSRPLPEGWTVRVLVPGDEPALESFLLKHSDSSIFLRSNLAQAGIVDRGEPLQGTYVAAIDAAGDIQGVICRSWNQNLVIQVPQKTETIARAADRFLPRPIDGILGPWGQALAVRTALGLDQTPTTLERREELYALPLDKLIIPAELTAGVVRCRRAEAADLDFLIQWRVAYTAEALNRKADSEAPAKCRAQIELWHRDGGLWVLESQGQLVAMTACSGVPDCVIVGNVWTPPELRRRGYARAVVAGSLLDVRAAGVTRAVLFADNPHAQQAYRALGFQVIGDYGLIFFGDV